MANERPIRVEGSMSDNMTDDLLNKSLAEQIDDKLMDIYQLLKRSSPGYKIIANPMVTEETQCDADPPHVDSKFRMFNEILPVVEQYERETQYKRVPKAQEFLSDMRPLEYRIVDTLPEIGEKDVIYTGAVRGKGSWVYHNDEWINIDGLKNNKEDK